jgi:putative restriction endonuclease
MTKAAFTTKPHAAYDDLPETRYHFPRTYLNHVLRSVGDFIVYYEPRRPTRELSSRGGRQSYFAVARVLRVEDDPGRPDHFYAYVEDFVEFDNVVPFSLQGRYFESGLQREDGGTSKGAFGRSVRLLPDHEFEAILAAGFQVAEGEFFGENDRATAERYGVRGVAEPMADFDRPVVETVSNRKFRDVAFRRQVRRAYDNRCAMTGLRLINGGGRPEVNAAHIRPVASHGPDSVRNGIALCGTAHWMFDRGLVAVEDNGRFLFADAGVPHDVRRLFNASGQLMLPDDETRRPHPQFLAFHRANIFKG